MAQKKPCDHQDGLVALMLCESLLDELEESDVITTAQALKVIDSVIELAREADSSGLACRGRQVRSATAIIETIRSSFDAKTKP